MATLGFGIGGKVTTDFSSVNSESVRALTIQSDGKIIVVGESYNNTSFATQVAVARYNTDGSLDTTFAISGKYTLDFASPG